LKEDVRRRDLILRKLEETEKLQEYKKLWEFWEEYEEFSEFFKKATGNRMWALQEFWAKRLLKKESFAIVAPTGIGKTSFGIVACVYLARKGKRCYILLPTSLLVEQVRERMEEAIRRVGAEVSMAFYHSGLKGKKRKEMRERIEKKEYDILITTNRFLSKNFDILPSFDMVFVDDVDSFLKSPRNIDKILILLGFPEEIVEKALAGEEVEEGIEHGILIVSGATQRSRRTKRIKLFRKLLKFELGRKPEFLRNMKDFYKFVEEGRIKEETLSIVKKFGEGCLIFVPLHLGRDFAKEIHEFLQENGIRSYVYEKMEPNILDKFEKKEIDCLVGVASYASPLARGIDLPEWVRYTIFSGVPKFKIALRKKEHNPSRLLIILKNLRDFFSEEERKEAEKLIQRLKKVVPRKKKILEKIEKGRAEDDFEKYVLNLVKETQSFLGKVLTQEFLKKIEESDKILLKPEEEGLVLFIADPVAYIQASGRASRLFPGGVSRGVSILLVDERKAFNDLRKKCKFFVEDIEFEEYEEKKIERWFKKVDEDRMLIRKVREGKITKRTRNLMKVALMVVESPTKARTIARFFGKPYRREIGNLVVFETFMGNYVLDVVATMGHIFDLANRPGYYGVLKIGENFIPVYDFIKKCKKCGEQFTEFPKCPNCKSEEIFSKESVVNMLRELASEVNEVFIATDADAEGEKIGYDIFCALAPYNKNIYRIEFHEITRRAVSEAIKKKRSIDERLVDAQIVRRIEDRWIGFELSRIVQKRFRNRRLSAGRVQTPVLGWVIERCKEAKKKKLISVLKLENGLWVRIERAVSKEIREAEVEVKEEVEVLNPQPPYTTDTLLKEAFRKHRFSTDKTMKLAQDLFELGLCTYHRTDSTTVSPTGMRIAREYIEENFGAKFKGRSWKKEGAHECIRPTRDVDTRKLRELIEEGIWRFPKRLTTDHLKLYDLIFRRFMASQMIPAEVVKQKIKVKIGDEEVEQERVVEIKEKGFIHLIPLKVEERVRPGRFKIVFIRRKWIPTAYPLTQGEIVSMMKERGIGRPSTYAKIIQTLFERNYVFSKNSWVINSLLGYKIYSFLSSNYQTYVSEELTRNLERQMRDVEEGRVEYQEILRELFEEMRKMRRRCSRFFGMNRVQV